MRNAVLTLTVTILSVLAICPYAVIQIRADDVADSSARVQELLRRAREALGGETTLSAVHSLSASAKYHRPTRYVLVSHKKVEEKVKKLSGKMEFDYLAPDRFRRKESGETLREFSYSFVEVINGRDAWRDPPAPPPTRASGRIVNVEDVAEAERQRAQLLQLQFTYYLLAWFGRTSPSYPVEMNYAGELELEGQRAEAILVRGDKGYSFLLLLDKLTHRPVMICTTFVDALNLPVLFQPVPFSRQINREIFAAARREAAARRKKAQRVDMRLILSDYRPVGGLLLPHRLTTTFNHEVHEELEIRQYKINHEIKAKKFEDKRDERP
ncbi:MAG TPA: hypothetical protein VNQ79_05240 [Blastocatellia bacterium]|nr:hypothetical protein [Blastocatellia bacterium]